MKLREYIRKLISKQVAENKDITNEGIVSGVMNHIKGILDKSNDKRLERSLQKIADESPEGKKAVDNLMKKIKATGNAVKKADDLMAKADIFS
jgi:DNA topoisomerase IA|tara:strand:+ start:938 stop:1216 length:279 start_codon:yes stop_codon:yes gene_type:complete